LVNQVQFSQDGQVLATAGIDRTTRIWEATTGKLVTLLQHPMAPTSIALDPTGQKVLVAIPDGTATLFDTATRTPQVILAGHREAISKLAFSPEGSVIVTASSDGTARLWDAKTGTNRAILPVNAQGIQTVSQVFFSPDGHYVAVLDQEGRIHWWAATWEQLLDLARDRSLRQLTSEECFRYLRLPPNLCPTLPIADRSMPKPKN
jgi:WD40 repeat protein